jgi:precorrin-6A synthase
MRKLLVVGIGAGNPEHITVQAINALNRADVLFIPEKGEEKADLTDLRREIVSRYVTNAEARLVPFAVPRRDVANPSYAGGVADWHQAIADIYVRLLAEELPDGGTGAFLVWGDPSLYDSTLRILARARAMAPEFAVEVIPGITSVQALTAAHGIALNRIGEPVLTTTGRRLGTAPQDDTVVMLDGQLAFKALEGGDYDIWWGAYLGTAEEVLISGRLADVAAEIERVRAEARAEHGWIMDTYLLRRRGP